MDAPRADPRDRRGDLQLRVGILTFHNTTNYGATLQALGLSRALTRRGCTVEIIDYRPPIATAYYRPRFREPDAIAKYVKRLKFNVLFRRHLTRSPAACARAEDLPRITAGRYDAVIAGSDQVWNVKEGFRPFDPSFYLSFVNGGVRKLTYAASFGGPFPLEAYRDRIAAELKRLDDISVRDEHSRTLVREIAQRDAQLVADPTLLDDLSDLEVAPPAALRGAVYYGPDAAGLGAHAVRWCRPRRLPVSFLGYRGPAGSPSRIGIGPGEWMGHVRASALVVTSTFHGAVFAAKMGRPFIVIARDWNAIKIRDFVERIGLGHRVFRDDECPSALPDDLWDHTDVIGAQEAIARLRAQSEAYLDHALAAAAPHRGN